MSETKRRDWSLMTKTHGGTVSILRDLTLDECRETYKRLNPWLGYTSTQYEMPPSDGFSSGVFSCGGRTVHDGDIEVREVFGPPDWDKNEVKGWDEWPKFETIKLDDPRHPNNSAPPPESKNRAVERVKRWWAA